MDIKLQNIFLLMGLLIFNIDFTYGQNRIKPVSYIKSIN